MRKKGLEDACLCEGFSQPRIKLQPPLDKIWHLDKKLQEIA